MKKHTFWSRLALRALYFGVLALIAPLKPLLRIMLSLRGIDHKLLNDVDIFKVHVKTVFEEPKRVQLRGHEEGRPAMSVDITETDWALKIRANRAKMLADGEVGYIKRSRRGTLPEEPSEEDLEGVEMGKFVTDAFGNRREEVPNFERLAELVKRSEDKQE